MPEQGRWDRASPLLAMHCGDQVHSKPLRDRGPVEVVVGPDISASPILFARKGTKMTRLLFWCIDSSKARSGMYVGSCQHALSGTKSLCFVLS